MIEKVCLFVDNGNLFAACQGFGNRKIDYIKLKEFLANQRNLNRSNFYYNEPNKEEDDADSIKKRKAFYYVLEKSGYNITSLPQTDDGLNICLEVVYDMCSLSRDAKFDTFILVAGDEEYARVVDRIKNDTGMNVEVAFFEECCSYKLMDVATEFVNLSKYTNEIFRSAE